MDVYDELSCAVRWFPVLCDTWHREPPATPAAEGVAAKVVRLHALNFALWHLEDAARRPGADDGEVARCKRAIDETNGRRNDAVEDVDATLLLALPSAVPHAPPHTETPGTIIDRLSVLVLRIDHAARAGRQADRMVVLREQHGDLLAGLDRYLVRLRAGAVTFTVYRQFKANDARDHCPHQFAW